MKNFYITTAIDYVNGKPHIGHAYEKILADVISRYHRLKGEDVFYLTGVDEHGQKVQQSARKEGVSPQEFCDRIAGDFKGLYEGLNISYDHFIRTTESSHKAVVLKLLQDLYDRGEIYKSEYTGYYSARAEQFLQEKDRQEDGNWPEIYGEVTEIKESNYFFKLSQYQDWLISYIKENKEFIFPEFRAKQVLEFLKEPLNDLCISRPKERLEWGIPLPFDSEYVTYVWFDALLNYISGIGYGSEKFKDNWPADVQVIGKDILVPPHAVYWPIMLKACNIELPKQILVHGWWLTKGEKMSKSKGNVIDPLAMIDQFGVDPFRYFLIREMNVVQDSDFSEELFISRYNSDLANDLGNLVSRLLNMTSRYTEQKIPVATISEDPEKELQALWQTVSSELPALFDSYQFHSGLERVFKFITGINRYAEIRSPWKLAKSEASEDQEIMKTSLAVMAEGVRLALIYLEPVMPETVFKIRELLAINHLEMDLNQNTQWSTVLEGNQMGEKVILFPKPLS